MFPQRKVFLIFWKNGTLIFQKMKLSSSKIKRFQEGIFQDRKKKKTRSEIFFYILENELSSPKLEKLLCFL